MRPAQLGKEGQPAGFLVPHKPVYVPTSERESRKHMGNVDVLFSKKRNRANTYAHLDDLAGSTIDETTLYHPP